MIVMHDFMAILWPKTNGGIIQYNKHIELRSHLDHPNQIIFTKLLASIERCNLEREKGHFFLYCGRFSFIFSFLSFANNSKCPARFANCSSVFAIKPAVIFLFILCFLMSLDFFGVIDRGPIFDVGLRKGSIC